MSRCLVCRSRMIAQRDYYARAESDRVGLVRAGGRGLCDPCYRRHKRNGTLADFESKQLAWPDLEAELNALGFDPRQPRRPQLHRIAERLGRNADAIERAYYRNRSAS